MCYVVVVLGRRAGAAGDPVEDVDVGAVEERLIAVELSLVEAGQMRIGKAKTSHKIKLRPSTRFKDVAGVEEAKAEVREIVDFLRNPRKYKRLGGNFQD